MAHIMTCEGDVTPLLFPAWQLRIELRASSQEAGVQTNRVCGYFCIDGLWNYGEYYIDKYLENS